MLSFCTVVNDETQVQPFENRFQLRTITPIEKKERHSKREKPPSDKNGKDRSIPSGIELPNIYAIYQNKWSKHDFDKYSALKIVNTGEKADRNDGKLSNYIYDFFVNMDNIHLKRYLKIELKKDEDERIPQQRFKTGLVLFGLALINAQGDKIEADKDNDLFNEGRIHEIVSEISKAFAPFLLPMIKFLSELDLEDVITADYSADLT